MVSTEILQLLSTLILLVLIFISTEVECRRKPVCKKRGGTATTLPPTTTTIERGATTTTLPPTTTTLPPTTTTLLPTTTTLPPTTTTIEPCVGYGNYTGGSRLKINTDFLAYTDAEAACVAEGARIVNIKSAAMQQAVIEAAIATGQPINRHYWIGLKYIAPGNWQWTDGTELLLDANCASTNGVYQNWLTASTSCDGTYGYECAYLRYDGVQNNWQDKTCHNTYASICECEQ